MPCAHNPFVDERQVYGTIRFDRDCSLAAANKSGKGIGKLLDLFIEGNDMNRDEPVISKLPACFLLTEYLGFQKFFLDIFGKLVGSQTCGLDLPDSLKSDHAIRTNGDGFIELGIEDELDGDLIERVELVAPRWDVPFSLKEYANLVARTESIVSAHDVKGFGKILGLWGLLRPG